jgi:hypothetical protein
LRPMLPLMAQLERQRGRPRSAQVNHQRDPWHP